MLVKVRNQSVVVESDNESSKANHMTLSEVYIQSAVCHALCINVSYTLGWYMPFSIIYIYINKEEFKTAVPDFFRVVAEWVPNFLVYKSTANSRKCMYNSHTWAHTHVHVHTYTATQCLYMHVPGTHTLGSTHGWNWDLFPGGQSKNGQSGFCTK